MDWGKSQLLDNILPLVPEFNRYNDVVELPKGTSDKLDKLANKDVLAGRKARPASEFKNKTEYELHLFWVSEILGWNNMYIFIARTYRKIKRIQTINNT